MNVNEAHIASISRAIDFIEAHLREEITLADVADAVRYSLFHFCRMFNSVVHHTPYDYLMRRRLSEAARELINTDKKVIEIAFDYQFNSPETYTRAFKRMFAMQPSQWRKRGVLPARTLMPRLTRKYLHHLNQGTYLNPVLETRDELQLAGLMTYVNSEDTNSIRRLWEIVASEIAADIRIAVSQAPCLMYYGVFWSPESWEHAGWYYMAAIDAAALEHIPSAFVIKTLPATEYACFRHVDGPPTRVFTRDYVYHTWLPKSGRTLAAALEVEAYGPEQPETAAQEVEWTLLLPLWKIS